MEWVLQNFISILKFRFALFYINIFEANEGVDIKESKFAELLVNLVLNEDRLTNVRREF